MKKILLFLVAILIYILGMAQPNGHGQGDPCKNPNNPHCNPAPIEGIWIILGIGISLGIYMTLKDKLWKNQTSKN